MKRRAASDVRRPPLLPFERGRCRWCGEPIAPRLKKDGAPHAVQAAFHGRGEGDCGAEYRACFGAQNFYSAIAKRDGAKCRACGVQPWSWWPCRGDKRHPEVVYQSGWPDSRAVPYTPVEYRIVGLEVDHVVPLWKVATLDQPKRRFYFLPENMQILCTPCHARKTAGEAAERAHFNRLAAPDGQPPLLALDGTRLA